ncbi:hypothetical protein Dimus_010058 [Dionaea muscipula]
MSASLALWKSGIQSVLNSCKHLKEFKQVHAHIIKQPSLSPHGISFHVSKLASLCAVLTTQHGSLPYAKTIFHQLQNPPISLWNSLIRGLSLSNHPLDAPALYRTLLMCGLRPNNFTFPFLIKACTSTSLTPALHYGIGGLLIHAHVVQLGLQGDRHIQTSLIHFYATARFDLDSANKVFHYLSCNDDDVVSWNSMIDGCIKCGDTKLARSVFDKMPRKDVISWNAMINGYGVSGEVREAGKLFDEMPERNNVSWNSMLAAYAKCGKVDDALELFQRMPYRDVVSWNTMLACYEQSGRSKETLALFHKMQHGGFVKPDEITCATVLSACADLCALEQGKRVHEYIIEHKIELNSIVNTALLDMYSRSGCISEAVEVFFSIDDKDVLAWNTILSAMARHGRGEEALRLFEQMQGEGIEPNEMTFGALLTACSHSGMVEEGERLLRRMGSDPKIEHYGCVIDLLARSGHLGKAIELVKSMPMEPNAIIWRALSAGCRIHANNQVGRRVGKRVINLEPYHSRRYIRHLFYNITVEGSSRAGEPDQEISLSIQRQ